MIARMSRVASGADFIFSQSQLQCELLVHLDPSSHLYTLN